MFHRSMYLGRGYKSTLRSASSQNLIKATADVILFPQIWRNFSNIASISIDIFRGIIIACNTMAFYVTQYPP